MKENKTTKKIFWAAFTAILTEALNQYGWIAFGMALVIIFVAIAGYDLIQADKEQKVKEEAEAGKLADKLAKALEKIEALEAKLQGSKKGGDENE